MIEHIGNCHGEITMLIGFLTSIPFIGAWIRAWRAKRKAKNCPCGHEGGEQH